MDTTFGKELKKLRVDEELTLGELGDKLGKSAGFLSGIETGTRPVPSGFVGELRAAFSLKADVVKRLEELADKGRKETLVLKVKSKNEFTQRLAVAFARNLDNMSARDQKDLMAFFEDLDKKRG